MDFKSFVMLIVALGGMTSAIADNQTLTTTDIIAGSALPFNIVIEQANFSLPDGLHSGAYAVYQDKWVFIAGRMNGLHGFGGDPFPADEQNTSVYVVFPKTGAAVSRSLINSGSGLTQAQIDSLTVTAPQAFQDGDTLYMVGGYGYDTATATFTTKPILTAIYLPGLINWVLQPDNPNNNVAKNIRQVSNTVLQVTGGRMYKVGNMTQLVFGQDFEGVYTPGSNGIYTEQVRQFEITNVNGRLAIAHYQPIPQTPDGSYRRRDINVLPALLNQNNMLQYGLVAYAGVFTDTGGVWTVPVVVNNRGVPAMADPAASTTFKQGMNQYRCAAASLYSKRTANMYHILFGGLSYGYYSGGVFTTDTEVPFINQVTTIRMDKNGRFNQYLMANEYPVILSEFSNPGNQLLFGADAYFIPADISQYSNQIINLDNFRQPTVIGYIVGGIMSTLPNTNVESDSAASPYVFKVTLIPGNTYA